MNKLFVALVSALTASASFAADVYTIDPRHTFPSFEIDHLGFSTQRGRFNETGGKITLDPKSADGGRIAVVIQTASISTGLAELEKHLRSKDFFDADRYPQISFNSDKLTFIGEKLAAVDGKLTMHGITKPVRLTVDRFNCGVNPISMKNVCGANAVGTLKRSDFGIDKYAPLLADEVKVVIQIEATKN